MLDTRKVHGWTKGRFSMDSGYYAGRGPTKSDLNSDLLEMIYEGIKKDAGAEVAANFVRFVNKLDDLSASAFIVAFESFAAAGGKIIEVAQSIKDGIRITGHGKARDIQALGVIAHTLYGPRRTETEMRQANDSIRCQFIQKHLDEIPTSERREMNPFAYGF